MREESTDVVIVGSGPTGSAYARIIRREWPEARILMVEAGPQLLPKVGAHLDNVQDYNERTALEVQAQGGDRNPRTPISSDEWQARREGRFDASQLRRSGLFMANQSDGADNLFAGFSAANVGGMGTKWSTGCPTPSDAERVPFIDDAEMNSAIGLGQKLLGVHMDPHAGDPTAAALRAKLGAEFNAGRSPDRFVQPMPLAATPGPKGLTYHGTDVVLGPMVDEPSDLFRIMSETACRRVIHDGSRVTGVELAHPGSNDSWTVRAGTVVVAGDSLHSPQLLHASGIRPAALGRYLNDHYLLSQIVELHSAQPLRSMSWIPATSDFPFSVTVAPASLNTMPIPADFTGQPVGLGVFCPADLHSDNRVVFDDSRVDWLGLPTISIQWRQLPGDAPRLDQARATVQRIANTIGRPGPGFATSVLPVGSSLHYQGTMRMGQSNDGTSVCDSKSRVWGFDNLYVAGNGVIPTMTATNPTLFSVALATMGAQQIARDRHTVA